MEATASPETLVPPATLKRSEILTLANFKKNKTRIKQQNEGCPNANPEK
jgi:hypothetical protein